MTFNVTMKDYEGFGGFATLSNAELEEFQKALSAGYQSPRTDGGGALRVESLEATLRIVTFRGEHIVLWKDVQKVPAFSTVHEWNLQTSYGNDVGGWTREGEAGQVVDASYLRRSAFLKFISFQKEVTHPMLLVRPAHGDIMDMQTRDGALQTLQFAERALFTGNSDIIPESIDGFDAQLRKDSLYGIANTTNSNVIDLRGGPLLQETIEVGVNQILELYGRATDLYSAPRAMSDFAKGFYAKQRQLMPAPANGVAGGSLTAFESANGGLINLKRNIFLRSGRNGGKKLALTAASSPRAPNAPTISATNTPTTGSLFLAADAGNYYYRVSAINRFGESAASASSSAVGITAGDAGVVTITDTGGNDPATGYRVYRTPKAAAAGGGEQFAFEIPKPASGTITATDLNRYIPGCSRAYLFQMNLNAVSVAQLAPMMKLPLATISAAVRWLHLLYMCAVLYAPQWLVVFDNVADD